MPSQLTITALTGVPLVKAGDDLAAIALAAYAATGLAPEDGDVLVVAQKIVSKAEDRTVDVSTVEPSPQAVALAAEVQKDPRLVEVILSESRRIVRHRPNLMIAEHRRGWVMANAGIDHSNVAPSDGVDRVLLLPVDPDASAEALRQHLVDTTGKRIAIIISDSFGRPFRRGTVGIALGAAGLPAVIDWRGHPDLFGRKLEVTETGFADEIAAAASLVIVGVSLAPVILLSLAIARGRRST
jgi:coenzyme F420-0:L-glutamate ligase/coenzyme F420-1:gamma-L-glutamate ligase